MSSPLASPAYLDRDELLRESTAPEHANFGRTGCEATGPRNADGKRTPALSRRQVEAEFELFGWHDK